MKKITHVLCAAALAVGVVASSYAQPVSKKLVVYCPHPLVFIEPIVKKFEASTGIQTEVVAAGTGELLKRIEAESSNPLGDVMWGGSMSTLSSSKKFFEVYGRGAFLLVWSKFNKFVDFSHHFLLLQRILF